VSSINEEILMLEILALQVIAATMGTLSIGVADWLYQHERIRQPLHSLWVSASSTAICLPLLTWTVDVFLGVGVTSRVLVGALVLIMFTWMYRNLLRVPTVQRPLARQGAPSAGASRPVPPSSKING
jgi:hypothetical protein